MKFNLKMYPVTAASSLISRRVIYTMSDYATCILIGLLALAALFVLFNKPIRALFKLILRSLVGASAIFALDFVLSPVGLAVGINAFTAAVTGLLGMPGLIMLYSLAWILNK
jgi:inhibitor of the pro-sigma K processing machinery